MTEPLAGLAEAIGQACRLRLEAAPAQRVHGGSIDDCRRWMSTAGPLFVKLTAPAERARLEAEAAGLRALAAANAVRVPRVLGAGVSAAHAFLALEWIDLGGASESSTGRLGERLALQHRASAAAFGWERDNFIGTTPQHNGWQAQWVSFWGNERLGSQLELAARNGHEAALVRQGRRLIEHLGAFFVDHRPAPSLLHGDLWGGNWGADASGTPVIFDPAVYYGDREADLAMTRLFGGFPPAFYTAYQAAWPLAADAARRVPLYNLYHVLNHLNRFGGGYLRQARSMIDALLAEAGA